jgi:PilZ domain
LVFIVKAVLLPNQFKRAMAALAQPIPATAEGAERRTEIRYPAQDPAELEVLPGPGELMFGTILDVSRSGLKVALSKRIDRGEQVKVKLHNNVIFGEIRYCRSVSGVFHAGIRISDLVRPEGRQNQHISDDALSIYAIGKGLSVPEIIEFREHLSRCLACRSRLGEKQALLSPTRKALPIAW